MCGIVGYFAVNNGKAIAERDLLNMRDRLAHRGPDDAGLSIWRHGDRSVGLAHRRLSIIDLSPDGRQPMATADDSLWIVFNGEIFNYRELRTELEQTGRYSFRSQSDTEVILYAVREWGLDGCLARLRGMYAFALFDRAAGELTLVRDPLGVKPLYYMRSSERLVFASEIKALLAAPGVTPRIDDAALYHYLTFAVSPAPDTMFAGIRKLHAGTFLQMDARGHVTQKRYWDPSRVVPAHDDRTEEDSIDELRRLLRQAVTRRMRSDVPVGAFLSGGLDSSLILALMAGQADHPVETYTVGIAGDPASERGHARQVSERFGARHHDLVISDEEFLSFLPRMAYVQDEPLADPVCVPLYYLSQLARDCGTPVIQVGEGSDELFAGYPIYQRFDRWNRRAYQPLLRLPHVLRSALYDWARDRVRPELADALRRARDGDPFFLGNAVAFWDHEKNSLLKQEYQPAITSSAYIRGLLEHTRSRDALTGMTVIELSNRLPELLLMRVDKMSMAASIETRVPFLDEDLVAFALTVPSAIKLQDGTPKSLLKKAAEGILPREIIDRAKWGFCGSATSMLTDTLLRYAHSRILDSPLIAGRFNREAIEHIFMRHRHQRRFNSFKIWNLLNVVLWHEAWFEGRNAAEFQRCNTPGADRFDYHRTPQPYELEKEVMSAQDPGKI
jgi:asparagine synthase (glutamine-hydrolysing)